MSSSSCISATRTRLPNTRFLKLGYRGSLSLSRLRKRPAIKSSIKRRTWLPRWSLLSPSRERGGGAGAPSEAEKRPGKKQRQKEGAGAPPPPPPPRSKKGGGEKGRSHVL